MPSTPLLFLGALLGYGLLMVSNPIRESLRDGGRAVRRYPALAGVLGLLGFAYTLFHFGIHLYLSTSARPETEPLLRWARSPYRAGADWLAGHTDSLWYLPPGAATEAAGTAWVPMLDSTAGLFNCLIPTFPLAALAAVLLLINFGGHQGVVWRALRRRLGLWAFLAHPFLLFSAVAAMAKPFLYAVPASINAPPGLLWAPVVNWLGFQFEYLFGVCVQLYLLLLAWCWVRGLTFRHPQLLAFAIRRSSFVLRWAVVVMMVSTLVIDLPLLLENLPASSYWHPAGAAELDRRLTLARVALDVLFLATCSVQITLTLHNESLPRSLRDHLRFARRNWWPLGWLISVAAGHFYALHFADLLCRRGFGEGTALWAAWSLGFPWLAGALGAWLLASWVSIFRRLDAGRLADREWVGF